MFYFLFNFLESYRSIYIFLQTQCQESTRVWRQRESEAVVANIELGNHQVDVEFVVTERKP